MLTDEHHGRVSQRRMHVGASQSRIIQALARRGDLLLAVLIVAVITLLLAPLPTAALDALIATNLAASISLLMLSLYISSATALPTFPSLLLLTTLFRLSLNIASTKSILLNGAAGHIIDTFGRLVVGGNVLVGLVVFLIIAIVQFIVIAKGAERVAEVAARFSLDGMPGKQMSIDADLRAGSIDKEEAQRRRRDLAEESQLNGAMDGAMKFVKGDAIAGMLIAFVNIVAGIVIGVTMRGMTLGESVETYSVLSIGDGMVAQIPSLFVSIASGILITRVGGKRKDGSHLGVQIATEVFGHPIALRMGGVIVASFLAVPGLPAWPFLSLAAVLLGAGYLARKASSTTDVFDGSVATPAMVRDGPPSHSVLPEQNVAPIAVPLRVRIAPALRDTLSARAFDVALEREKTTLAQELGLPFPGLQMSVDGGLAAGQYAIDVQEIQVSQADLENSNVLSFSSQSSPDTDPTTRDEGSMSTVAGSNRERALATHVAWVVRRHADAFIGMQEAHELLARAATRLPDLVAEAQKTIPLQRFADVLRRLLEEGVSIRHLREICESLILWVPREKDIVMLTEYVRVDLGRFIVRPHLDHGDQLHAIVLDAAVEKALRDAIQQGPGGSFLALAPETAQALLVGAETALSTMRSERQQVVVAPMDVRRYLRKFIAARFPACTVLSYQELPAHVQVQVISRLTLQPGELRRAVGARS
jgi:type III secretion protein V